MTRAGKATIVRRIDKTVADAYGAGTFEEMLHLLAREARFMIGAHQCAISYVPDGDFRAAIHTHSLSKKYSKYNTYDVMPTGKGIWEVIAQNKVAIRMTQDKLVSHPRWKNFSELKDERGLEHPPMRGWLAVPIVGQRGGFLGVLQLSDRYEGGFSQHDEDELARLATLITPTFELQYVNKELRSRSEELSRNKASLTKLNKRLRHEMAIRREAEESLRRSERLASIGTLVAGIGHEINNPLGGILLAAQFALEFKDDSNAVADALKAIVRQTKRCAEVVSGLLTFAQEGRSERRPTDLNSAVRHARDLIRGYVEEKGAALELLLADDLPELDLNETEIALVIVNLIRNSVQAGAESIRLCTQRFSDCIQLTLQDDGPGIPDKRRIFEPFYTTREKEGGTGLGLSIAHGIVTGHAGTIDLESTDAGGTIVTIRLPLAGDGRG